MKDKEPLQFPITVEAEHRQIKLKQRTWEKALAERQKNDSESEEININNYGHNRWNRIKTGICVGATKFWLFLRS